MSTIRIPLNSRKYPGLYALIDEDDFELVSQYSWHPVVHAHRGIIYARSSHKGILMHRLILPADDGMVVDHINRDALDNRRENLRQATTAENCSNSGMRRGNRTGYKGINITRNGKWQARISVNGRSLSVGTFGTPIDAARAYDKAAEGLRGEFAVTNSSLGLLD